MAETKKRNSNKEGKEWEDMLTSQFTKYRKTGEMYCIKIPTEMVLLRRGKNIVSAFPKAKSEALDYLGILKDGRCISFEAKSTTNKTSFPLSQIKPYQFELHKEIRQYTKEVFYIIRFKTLGFPAAITAIIALIHDVLFIIAIYGIIKFPINTTFVAVALTIIGYSINDTIIVYDRIRENKKKITRSKDLLETINLSISQVLNRTIITSLTTVVAVIVIYIFAVINNQQTLKEFSLPLIIGVVVGTYSSLFIASSLWYSLEKAIDKFKAKKGKKKKA